LAIEFSCFVEKPFSIGRLARATERLFEEVLQQPSATVSAQALNGETFWNDRSAPPLPGETVEREIDVAAESGAFLLTVHGTADACEVRYGSTFVLAESQRSCLSTMTAMLVILAAARVAGETVEQAGDYANGLRPPSGIDHGLPVEDIVAYLRLAPGTRDFEGALIKVLAKTPYPCHEHAAHVMI
jgi:hypothetical protein